MSYGGTGLMINCIILGIALSVINYRSVTPFEISIERR
jgi:cell division protein FtsW (lipid II flippase)